MKRSTLFVLGLFAVVSLLAIPVSRTVHAQSTGEPAVSVQVRPDRPYIEVSESNQHLNFDFRIENQTGKVLQLRRICLTVTDESRRPVVRRVLDERAMKASIETVPTRKLEPKGVLFLFNPFYLFDREMPLASLKYEFTFSTPEDSMLSPVTVTVHPVQYENRTNLTIPLRGRVLVEDGHDFYSHHRRVDLAHPIAKRRGVKTNPTLFALDLTLCDARGWPYTGRGDRLGDWYGYGAPVYAPGDGTVVRMVDGTPDNTLEDGSVVYSEALNPQNPESMLGNYLILDHGNSEYSLLSHLKAGSFRVQEGQRVQQGQELAAIGFSGETGNVVHVHYQLQTGTDFFDMETLPAYFRDFRRLIGSDSVIVSHGPINTGDIVEPLQALSK